MELLQRGKKQHARAQTRMTNPRMMKAVLFLGFLLSTLFLVNYLGKATYFPIQEVKIVGAQRSDHNEIQHLILPLVSRGFFGVDVGEIKERIAQAPWVSHLMVRRIWPNQVLIQITEKIPVARWNDHTLLGSQGELFHPTEASIPQHLPNFIGPEGDHVRMLSYYQKINNLLYPLHFKILSLEFTPYSIWRITFDNGIKLTTGHKGVLASLDRFVKLYPKVVGDRLDRVEYIDLRYSNGIAVKWKSTVVS
jgi:cell division protein FtsQ